MSDKFWNLVAALEDANPFHDINVGVMPDLDYDYCISVQRIYDNDGSKYRNLDMNAVIDHSGEFENVELSFYNRDDTISCVNRDGVRKQVADIRVKE